MPRTHSGSHRPVPRRTSSSFLSTFTGASSSTKPVLTNPPPTSFHRLPTTRGAAAAQHGAEDASSPMDGSSIYSDATTLASGYGASEGVGRPYAGSISSGTGGGLGGVQGTRAALGEMLNKRLGTWDALKRAHQGTLYWSNTIHLPLPAIQANVEPAVFRSRPYAFSVLGMSLAPLLEIKTLADVVTYTNRTLDQYDSAAAHVGGGVSSLNKGGTMKGIFKGGSKSGKRPSIGAASVGGDGVVNVGGLDGFGSDFLTVYNQPFTPDYFQTLTTFFDVLIELYNKIFSLLSPQLVASHAMRSQLLTLPVPLNQALERTYLASSTSPSSSGAHGNGTLKTAITVTDASSTSWRYPTPTQTQGVFSRSPSVKAGSSGEGPSVGHGQSQPGWENSMTAGFQSPPLTLSGTTQSGSSMRGSLGGDPVRHEVLEGISKLDARIRKITNVVMKELETLARKEIKEETSHLERLLSVISPSDEDHFTPPSGLASASLWALGTTEADRAVKRFVPA